MAQVIGEQCIFILRLFLAGVCGGVIGYERKNRGKGAGIRTHTIVAIASALMMIVSKYGFTDMVGYDGIRNADASRIASQVVSGVGFLGAGMIYFNRHAIKGLTTAAGIWATSGVGLALGAGMYAIGIVSTLIIVVSQILLHKNLPFLSMPNEEILTIVLEDDKESMDFLNNMLTEYGISIESMKCSRQDDNKIETELSVTIPNGIDTKQFLLLFQESKCVYSVSI